MSDLISRQAAIDAMSCLIDSICEGQAVDALSELPTIDPVKHGKWIPIHERAAKCSLCGEWEYTNGIDKTGTAIIHRAIKHYCPNCGAEMT